MDANNIKNAKTTTDYTKQICYYTFFVIILIIIFIISPLKKFVIVSTIIKIGILIILAYTIYLNNIQTNMLKSGINVKNDPELSSQLNSNIMASYVFTVFLAILFIFVLKSVFY